MEIDVFLNTNHAKGFIEEESTAIGKASIHIIDSTWMENKGDTSFIAQLHLDYNDESNWNSYTPYEFLEDALKCVKYETLNGLNGKIAVLHKMEIFSDFRGFGYSHVFVKQIIQLMKRLSCDYLILQPHPFGDYYEDDNEKEYYKQRLIKLYSKHGLEIFPFEAPHPYMYVKLKEESLIGGSCRW